METVKEITPKAQELAKETESMALGFTDYKVETNVGYKTAGEHLKDIKARSKDLEALRKSLTTPLDIAKKRIMEFFRRPQNALWFAEKAIKRAIITFQDVQEEIRRKEEARLQELARKEEEKKRKALEKKAEKAEEKGNAEQAEELREQAEDVNVPAPIVPPQVEKVAGVSTKKVWKFRVVNAKALPREYLIPNEKMLGEIARATKGTLAIPGVEIYSEDTIAAGR